MEAYPRFRAEIKRMIEKKARTKRMANRIARKADITLAGGPGGAKTVIDAYINPLEANLARQYATDFTGVSEVRLTSRSDSPIYILYSTDPPGGLLNPGFSPFSPALSASSAGDSGWLATDFEGEMRLVLSTQPSAVRMEATVSAEPFAVLMQAR
jgi:hypothetical protein